jgi:hypothetical protein
VLEGLLLCLEAGFSALIDGYKKMSRFARASLCAWFCAWSLDFLFELMLWAFVFGGLIFVVQFMLEKNVRAARELYFAHEGLLLCLEAWFCAGIDGYKKMSRFARASLVHGFVLGAFLLCLN